MTRRVIINRPHILGIEALGNRVEVAVAVAVDTWAENMAGANVVVHNPLD
jgi:hypothetical protein